MYSIPDFIEFDDFISIAAMGMVGARTLYTNYKHNSNSRYKNGTKDYECSVD